MVYHPETDIKILREWPKELHFEDDLRAERTEPLVFLPRPATVPSVSGRSICALAPIVRGTGDGHRYLDPDDYLLAKYLRSRFAVRKPR